jgi:hypothetical protein
VSDVPDPLDPFQLGILDDVTGLKTLVDSDVDIFIDCRAD